MGNEGGRARPGHRWLVHRFRCRPCVEVPPAGSGGRGCRREQAEGVVLTPAISVVQVGAQVVQQQCDSFLVGDRIAEPFQEGRRGEWCLWYDRQKGKQMPSLFGGTKAARPCAVVGIEDIWLLVRLHGLLPRARRGSVVQERAGG